MTKKIIAVLIVVTVLFVCVFAACQNNDEESIYSEGKDFIFVTDENGEKVLDEKGKLIVYVTDEDGKFVKDENGEKVTRAQTFVPIEENGIVEDYGFKLALPKGWKTTSEFGVFTNEGKQQDCTISVVKYFYDDYYDHNYKMYEELKAAEVDVTWEKNVDLGEGFNKACRFSMKSAEGISVLYFFENADNVYKVLFTSLNPETTVADADEFCKALTFKPFTYYDDITAVSKEETTK